MRLRITLSAVFVSLFMWSALYAFQFGRRGGFRGEDTDMPTPPDASEKTEWAFARLKYPSYRYGNWTIDYPRADRHFVQGVRRLTRLHTRSIEEVVDIDSDELYNWPWVYAVEVGHWDLTDEECKRMRDYLLRGGFLMVDDFHGTAEWETFMASMSRIFPDRPVVELENRDQIFHVLYDLDQRFQVPGTAAMYRGTTYEKDGIEPRWRAIMDDKGRVMVAICHNMDLGDSWEHADNPRYPEKYTSLGYRIAINYIMYSMTH
jgi:hypothetical protein